MNETISIRIFSEKKSDLLPISKVIPSGYWPLPMAEAFWKLNLHDDEYVLCPLYNAGDIQSGVTGTIQTKEKPIDAIVREMGEEVGIIPIKAKLKLIGKFIRMSDNEHFHVYNIELRHCIKVPAKQNNVKKDNGNDLRKQKVGCFIYGSRDAMISYLNSPIIARYYSTDAINGIGALSARLIRSYYK